jgi:hypothetical protein
LEEQMKSTMAGDYDLETSGVETRILTDENKKNIIDYLQKKYQTQIFVLSNLSNELYCRWAKKTLNKDETELFEKINTAICKAILIARVDTRFINKGFFEWVLGKGIVGTSAVRIHLQEKFPELEMTISGENVGKIEWYGLLRK